MRHLAWLDVDLYTTPWVSGTRAVSYFGAQEAEVFVRNAPKKTREERCRIVRALLLPSRNRPSRSRAPDWS